MLKTLASLLVAAALAPGAVSAATNYFIVTPVVGVRAVAPAPEPELEIRVELSQGQLPRAKVDQNYLYDLRPHLSVTGDPSYVPGTAVFTAGALPPGLTLQTSGELLGVPTEAANPASFEVVASFKDKVGRQVYKLVIGGVGIDAVAVSAGVSHTCAITPEQTVKCWGLNSTRQLGDGTTTTRTRPVSVVGLPAGASSITAGLYHTCALVSGAVYCWGENGSGQLGDGSVSLKTTPVRAVGLGSVSMVSAGGQHTCAVSDGAARCWGNNGRAQIGDGTATNRSRPTQVTGLTSGVSAIGVGDSHSCAVVSGAARCWGHNNYGQIGDGSSTQRASPVAVSGLSSGVTAIIGGGYHTCAVVSGTARCWGSNAYGQLGDGTTTQRPRPVASVGIPSAVTQIDTGADHTCAVTIEGGAYCWGANASGQLGDGTATNRTRPVAVIGLTGITDLVAGANHSCATIAGATMCWGQNSSAQLGDGTTVRKLTPVPVGK